MKVIAILGSTGSIGVSTLEVVKAHPEHYRVAALSGGRNLELLARQINFFRPRLAAVLDPAGVEQLRALLAEPDQCRIVHGVEGLIACAVVEEAEMVVSAIVGAAGLVPTMAAIEAGKDIALANKETLVAGGPLVMERVAARGVGLFPVDSEHSAIFQSLQGHRKEDVRKLILTASGGPFRRFGSAELAAVTPEQALRHPNWEMGAKITIDSATMMNKGLEVIEAFWLFDLPLEKVSVVVHPQSIVHSMVEYCDGAVIAQMGVADMQTPIAYALSCPRRLPLPLAPLDLCAVGRLDFEAPDPQRFPCLGLAYRALEAGGDSPAVMNASNEVAVAAFLAGEIGFTAIPQLIDAVLQRHDSHPLESVEGVMQADLGARRKARELVRQLPLERGQ